MSPIHQVTRVQNPGKAATTSQQQAEQPQGRGSRASSSHRPSCVPTAASKDQPVAASAIRAGAGRGPIEAPLEARPGGPWWEVGSALFLLCVLPGEGTCCKRADSRPPVRWTTSLERAAMTATARGSSQRKRSPRGSLSPGSPRPWVPRRGTASSQLQPARGTGQPAAGPGEGARCEGMGKGPGEGTQPAATTPTHTCPHIFPAQCRPALWALPPRQQQQVALSGAKAAPAV